MLAFSGNFEKSLHRALAVANERQHEYATLEHLLLALIDDEDAGTVMRAPRSCLRYTTRGAAPAEFIHTMWRTRR